MRTATRTSPPRNPVAMRFLSSGEMPPAASDGLSKRRLHDGARRGKPRAKPWCRRLADRTEPALAALELGDCERKVGRREVRPQALREHELGICGLPEQEVAHPLLAARPDHEVDVSKLLQLVRPKVARKE